jgi:hypothetical protein
MPSKRYLAIPGSRREVMPGATRTGPCDPGERLQVTVVFCESVHQENALKALPSLYPVASG